MPSSKSRDKGALLPGPLTILLMPEFTMIALSSVLEPLRIANRYISRPYVWRLVSMDGEPVADRNGVKVAVEGRLNESCDKGTLIVIADAPAPRRRAWDGRWQRRLAGLLVTILLILVAALAWLDTSGGHRFPASRIAARMRG